MSYMLAIEYRFDQVNNNKLARTQFNTWNVLIQYLKSVFPMVGYRTYNLCDRDTTLSKML